MMSSWKTRLMERRKEQAMIRRRVFYGASDQSLDFLSLYEHLQKHNFSSFRHNLKPIYEYEYIWPASCTKKTFGHAKSVDPDSRCVSDAASDQGMHFLTLLTSKAFIFLAV